jgi:hypothetical protein
VRARRPLAARVGYPRGAAIWTEARIAAGQVVPERPIVTFIVIVPGRHGSGHKSLGVLPRSKPLATRASHCAVASERVGRLRHRGLHVSRRYRGSFAALPDSLTIRARDFRYLQPQIFKLSRQHAKVPFMIEHEKFGMQAIRELARCSPGLGSKPAFDLLIDCRQRVRCRRKRGTFGLARAVGLA